MFRYVFILMVFASFSIGVTSPAFAKRIALVIGNDNYSNLPPQYQLQKAKNDARSTAETFKALGFEVIEGFDLKRREMNVQLSRFANAIEPGDEVVFFFAGHGVRIEGLNYLLPSDIPSINSASEDLLKSESVRVDEISDRFKRKGARLSILVLDACRNNPYEDTNGRSIGGARGLAAMDPPEGTLVLFSAGAGQRALDRLNDNDANPNSVFTRIFLPLVRQKGLELSRLSRQVKKQVRNLAKTIDHTQTPAVYNEVIGDVFLSGKEKDKIVQAPVNTADDTLWSSIATSQKASDFEFYLSKFPKGRYAAVAELKIKQLKEVDVAVGIYPDKKPLTRSYKPGDTFKDCDDCPEMVVIPPGEFMMGSPKSEKGRENDEGPRHKVTISKKFAVGKFEVTFDEWDACVKDGECNGYRPRDEGWGRGNLPVINVNWDNAKAYVKWLNTKVQGEPYKLLSEAEWEYVARAKSNKPFWWGKSISTAQANYNGNYSYNGSKGKYRKKTVPVDSFEANEFGLYNVHGNVWEWVEDCWHQNYRGAPKDGTAWTKDGDCKKRVLRGGAWSEYPHILRSADRFRINSVFGFNSNGFRVSRTLVSQVR